MAIHEIRVTQTGQDPLAAEVMHEAEATLNLSFGDVTTATVYRLEGVTDDEVKMLASSLLTDPITEQSTIDEPPAEEGSEVRHVAYQPGIMNPAVDSLMNAARMLGVNPAAADVSREYVFKPNRSPSPHLVTAPDIDHTVESANSPFALAVDQVVDRLLVNTTVQEVVTGAPETLISGGEVGLVQKIAISQLTENELKQVSEARSLHLNGDEMRVIQNHFKELGREPTDGEIETFAATWSEHCGHKTFNAKVIVDGVEKSPLYARIKQAAKEHFGDLVISAFKDNAGVMKFYDGLAIAGKVETHNSPSAVEPYGGAMTGTGGVVRDLMGVGKGSEVIISTNMHCVAPPDTAPESLPNGTLAPRYLLRKIIAGVRDYGNRFGIPTGNGSVHYHPDFGPKPTVMVGAYGIMPEKYAQKGVPEVGDLVVTIGGRTGRDGIHGATFSSGSMTAETATINSSSVQIGNAIEQQRMAKALLEARDADCIRAMTDCGAAGFCSAIGEIGEETGVSVDLSKAPLKYEGLDPWEIWISESQERMVAAISPDNIVQFIEICSKYNVEATVLGNFDGSHTLTVNYGEESVVELDYEFLMNGLPQRVMEAHWENPVLEERKPASPESEQEWLDRIEAVLAHGNVCSKEPIVRQYDHGVKGGTVTYPYGGSTQSGPNDALVIRPILGENYGIVQSHGMNPVLNNIDPYEGTVWAIAEAAANYVSAGGDLEQASAVGNYVWPKPDIKAMGSLDRSVDAAVDMMHLLKLPVISGKDSLSSTYENGEIKIEIPPVYTMSIFGRIPDVNKTMTTEIKAPGESQLYLVGNPSEGMAGSTYYDVTSGSSGSLPIIDQKELPKVLNGVRDAIATGGVLACHDISEGGLVTAVAEMAFGAVSSGVSITVPDGFDAEAFLFSETAGCFVLEIYDDATAKRILSGLPNQKIGKTLEDSRFQIQDHNEQLILKTSTGILKHAWQKPLEEVFHS